jgi:hypothetical protein
MVDKTGIQKIGCNNLLGDSTIKDSTGEDPINRKMKGKKRITIYHLMRFLHEIFYSLSAHFLFSLHI